MRKISLTILTVILGAALVVPGFAVEKKAAATKELKPVIAKAKEAPKAKKKAEMDEIGKPEVVLPVDQKVLDALNKLDASGLKSITGIGKALAEDIIAHRKASPLKAMLDFEKIKVDGKLKFAKTKSGKVSSALRNLVGKLRLHFNEEMVDLNTASVFKMRCLPGMSASVAKEIVAKRAKKPFKSADELLSFKNSKGKDIFKTKTGAPNKKFRLLAGRLVPAATVDLKVKEKKAKSKKKAKKEVEKETKKEVKAADKK